MRPLTKLFMLALALGIGLPAQPQAQTTGNCELGIASQDLDINNVRARLFNKGNLFFNGGTPLYEVPAGSGISPIFAGGIWIGGTVNGQVRTAAATYAQGGEDYEFYPGPLNEDGSLPNPSDCSQYDRMYKVSVVDIAAYRATGATTPDLNDWPVGLGAPTCIDQSDNGRCEPEEPQVAVTGRDQVIDLGSGQIPDILGDQGVWWVMNDVGGPHKTTLTPPMGMEVQVLAFAVSRADALGDATFYQYTFVYRGQETLENTFLTIWSDPDLGNFVDDYIGNDPDEGLGFVYNADNDDEASAGGYGMNPPALGYDFFVGPVTDADNDGDLDTLSMTKFGYYNNNMNPRVGNPDTFDDFYNYMRGFWRDGTPWTEGGDAQDESSTPVDFIYPNSGSQSMPTPGYWSEVCPTPDCGASIDPDDRRFTMSTGPFSMQPGEVQQVIYGIVWAQGDSNFGSIQAVKTADVLAQRFFDLNFQIAPPPPAPNVESALLSGEVAIKWSYPANGDPRVTNFGGGFLQADPLIAGLPGIEDSTYNFEGFNVYRYPNSDFADADRELVAVYDVINGITKIIDEALDPDVGTTVPFVAARGTDSGLQFYHIIDETVTNYRDYYYGVTAYAYNEESTPDVVESQAKTITVRPADVAAGASGSAANSEIGDGLLGARVDGSGDASVLVRVIDPTAVTGDTYRVEFESVADEGGINFDNNVLEPDSLTFRVINETTDEVEFDGVNAYTRSDSTLVVNPFENTVTVDGLALFLFEEPVRPAADSPLAPGEAVAPDFAGDGAGIVEVANPSGTDPCQGVSVDPRSEDYDPVCRFYGGNTVWLDPDPQGQYVVTTEDNDYSQLTASITALAPDDLEMRFTQACATPGTCLGVYASAAPSGTDLIASVPFELWNVGNGKNNSTVDDVRMIPILRPPTVGDETPVENWEDAFSTETREVVAGEDTLMRRASHRVLWMMPDRPNGYDLFAQDANTLFGGVGGTYDPEADGDTQIDLNPLSVEDCRTQGYYVAFCYRGGNSRLTSLLGGTRGMQIVDLADDGTTPDAGTVIRFLTVPNLLVSDGDVITINTSEFRFETGVDSVASAALDQIGVVPNPYRGFSVYETGQFDRRVRFINLPDAATIRIFTLSGTLIRTLQANNTRSFDWDLETENGLPVASGMYLVHVDTPAGERVLKLAVVNREARFDVF